MTDQLTTSALLGPVVGSLEDSMNTPLKQVVPELHSIRDRSQRVWILQDDSLISVPSKEGIKPVVICSLPCADPSLPIGENESLIYLGIRGTELCLFCAEIEGQPTLQLQKKNIGELSEEKEAQKPFLFRHTLEPAAALSAFESVAHPGWFIATSPGDNAPVILTPERGTVYNTDFYFTTKGQISSRF